MAEGTALEGLRLVKENIQEVYHNGKNIEARAHMLVASMMGAAAFQKGLGAIHSIHTQLILLSYSPWYHERNSDAFCLKLQSKHD